MTFGKWSFCSVLVGCVLLINGASTGRAADPVAPAANADPYQWSRSLPVDFQSPGVGTFGGTEARSLVAFDGKLFAGIGYWRDTQADDPALPGGQVLVLDGPDAKWKVDLSLDELKQSRPNPERKRFQAVATLAAFEARYGRDEDGNKQAHPVPFLLAGVWDRVGGLRIYARGAGAKATWSHYDLVKNAPLASQVRSFGTHFDAVTKRELFFAGTSPNGVYSGTLEADNANFVRWSKQPETWNGTRGTSAQGRVMAFAECNGKLYASSGYDLYERQDGASPSWKKVYGYEQPSDNPHFSGLRGMKAIPAPDGGEQLLISVECNPFKIIRVDPRQEQPHGTVDLDVSAFLSREWDTRVTFGIAAYNEMTAVRLPGDTADSLLIGFQATTPQDRAGVGLSSKHPWAHYLVRRADPSGQGHYEIHRIDDPRYPNLPLVTTRAITRSPFSQDPAGTVYAGGLDAGNLEVHNSAWIYRGVPAK